MQEESDGMLEVTGIISGSRQKRNIPRSSIAKAKDMLTAARENFSPTIAPSADSVIGVFPSGYVDLGDYKRSTATLSRYLYIISA